MGTTDLNFQTRLQIRHPLTVSQNFVTGDYVGDSYAKPNLVQIRPLEGANGQMREI